jgi:uncharacterized protein GlcG (DUF336 family)
MTALVWRGSVCRCAREEGHFGALRAHRRRNGPLPAPLGTPWTNTVETLAQRGRSAYTGWNRRVKKEIPDKTWLGSVDIAINKAWTARAFDTATDDLAKLTQSGQQGFGLNTTNNSRVVIFGGGIPVIINGVVIGAIGASGGSVEEDIMVARAAVTGFVDEP